MKIVRYMYQGTVFGGRVEEDSVISAFPGEKERVIKLQNVKLLAPVSPSKIVCAGLNYYDHAEELGMAIPTEPVIFIKPPSSVIGHNDHIMYPSQSKRVDFEGELAVVIGKEARNIRSMDAKDYVLGYTCFNDVTARDLQKKDVQWTRAKSFDTFAPLGPYVETDLDPGDLSIRSILNNRVVQSSRTSKLIFKIPELLEFISGIMTLFPGDIIATGTPGGIGPMLPQDEIAIEIEGIGRLVNRVVKITTQ